LTHTIRRKIIVIDEKVGFCGGMNISRHYVSEALGGTGRFRDTHARVRGPVVRQLLGVLQGTLNHRYAAHLTDASTQTTPPAAVGSDERAPSMRKRLFGGKRGVISSMASHRAPFSKVG
jgi:phosphatidylserine/phosphatidylglycerophosphate/cardiolipin synthase-like enzyme